MGRLRALGSLALAAAGAACTGWQSSLRPEGPQAADLAWLFWCFTAICGAIWLSVMLVLFGALYRQAAASERGERRARYVVGTAVIGTTLILCALVIASFTSHRALSHDESNALTIRVRGYQWWWEVTYIDARPDRGFVTANEIRIPVGRTARLELVAADVIHSFWIPNLAGKQDLIPGRINVLTLAAERPGTWRAQCAEFCGLQHAHMALLVIVEEPAAFEAWRETQRAGAAAAQDAEQESGRRFFSELACAACHTVRGTPAGGTLGPDLTHVASRRTIGAGMLPTTRGSLAAWIADPQTIKPGNNMPLVPMTPEQLRAISAWLAALR